MKRLIDYFIKNPFAGNVLVILIVLMGFFGLKGLRSTLMPQVDPGMIVVSATYPGASPEEIERGIILQIENNLKGISGIEKTTSTSSENAGQVLVELESGYDVNVVYQDVKNAVDGIVSFPSGMEPANVRILEFTTTAVQFALSGDMELRELKARARIVEDELRQLPGISKLTLSGFPGEEIEISVREDDLQRFNMTLDEVYSAVKKTNMDITGGTMRGETEELRIRARLKKYYADGLKHIVLRTNEDGGIVRLEDVADIKDTWAETPNSFFLDGKTSIMFTIKHTAKQDIIKISDEIKAYTARFNQKNKEVKLTLFDDRSDDIKSMQGVLLSNGFTGFILVIIFLSFALNYRLSFWVAISIPLSFLGMFMVGAMMDISLNRISMFGMILVIGILVDDGIVIAENIYQHFENGKSNLKAALDGTMEVIPAVFAAVLTTIIAFGAFFFLDGMMGEFFMEMAFVVIASLVFSLIEAALILPAHIGHSRALKGHVKPSWIEKKFTGLMSGLRDKIFEPVLRLALDHKLITIIIPIGLLLITFGAFKGGIIKSGDPNIEDKSFLQISLELPAGSTEKQTLSILNNIEKKALAVGEKFDPRHKTAGKTIRNINKQINSSRSGSITVLLQESVERLFHSAEFSNALQKEVGEIPEAERVNYQQTSQFGKPVSISIMSHNLEEIEKARIELKSELNKLAGLKNVEDDYNTGMREINIRLKDQAYLLGLDTDMVMSAIRKGVFGYEVQRLHRGQDEVKVWVRMNKADRSSIGKLENMRIRLQDGRNIPLKEIAHLSFERNFENIKHLDGRRQITIQADNKDETVAISEIKQAIRNTILPAIKKKYPSISFYFGGRDARLGKTYNSMGSIVPVTLILLLTVVIFTFRSFSQTFLIFAMVPFGFIGVGWGHFIHGIAIDMPSVLGIVALMGVMVNDSIVLISTVNNRKKKSDDYKAIVYEAAMSRFRPILLTSMTTIAGLAPLIITNNSSSRMVIPMAVSLAYGLIVSTFTTLLVLPAWLLVLDRIKYFTNKVLQKNKLNASVEKEMDPQVL